MITETCLSRGALTQHPKVILTNLTQHFMRCGYITKPLEGKVQEKYVTEEKGDVTIDTIRSLAVRKNGLQLKIRMELGYDFLEYGHEHLTLLIPENSLIIPLHLRGQGGMIIQINSHPFSEYEHPEENYLFSRMDCCDTTEPIIPNSVFLNPLKNGKVLEERIITTEPNKEGWYNVYTLPNS